MPEDTATRLSRLVAEIDFSSEQYYNLFPVEDSVQPSPDLSAELWTNLSSVMADVAKLRSELSRLRTGVEQLRMPAIEAIGLDRTAEQLRSLEMKIRPLGELLSSKEEESQVKRVLKDLLIAIDSLDRVFELMERQPESIPDGMQTGLRSVYQLIQDCFARHGLKQMQIGDTFDPHLHLAMGTEANPGKRDGEISRVLLAGYMYGEQVFRTAQVVVVKNDETNG